MRAYVYEVHHIGHMGSPDASIGDQERLNAPFPRHAVPGYTSGMARNLPIVISTSHRIDCVLTSEEELNCGL